MLRAKELEDELRLPVPIGGSGRRTKKVSMRRDPFSFADVHMLRNELSSAVKAAMPSFKKLLLGEEVWHPSRMKGFALAVSRLVPELSADYRQIDISDKRLTELSLDDLKLIASGKAKVLEADSASDDEIPFHRGEPDAAKCLEHKETNSVEP